jgi:hypothetical protein
MEQVALRPWDTKNAVKPHRLEAEDKPLVGQLVKGISEKEYPITDH